MHPILVTAACRGPTAWVSLRGGCSAALRLVPRVPGSRGLASGEPSDEAPRHPHPDARKKDEGLAPRAGGVTASSRQQKGGELMLTVMILIVFAAAGLVLVLLAVVVVAIRQSRATWR
jgi:hypothetical protein